MTNQQTNTMTIEKPHQLYTKEQAISLASQLQAEDSDWTYTPKHCPKGTGYSFIEITDETGAIVGRM